MSVSSSQAAPTGVADVPESAGPAEFKTLMTWRGVGADRLEQVRLHVAGDRVKAYGRIIAAASGDREAFSASYELITNDAGVTKRLSVHLVRADGESQLRIARDEEGNWLVDDGSDDKLRSDFGGAQDVDLALSPMFNALPIRRMGLAATEGGTDLPVAYVHLPSGTVEPATLHYTVDTDGIHVVSPLADSRLTIDDNGFVIDYSDLATRV
ncbi:putative glycolipid-binding domain-containing protein [Gordonia sinesedis]